VSSDLTRYGESRRAPFSSLRRRIRGRHNQTYSRVRSAKENEAEVYMNANCPAQVMHLPALPEPCRVSRSMPEARQTIRDCPGHHSRARVRRTLATPSHREVSNRPFLRNQAALPWHDRNRSPSRDTNPRAPRSQARTNQSAVGVQTLPLSHNSERTALICDALVVDGVGGSRTIGALRPHRRAGKFSRPRMSTRGQFVSNTWTSMILCNRRSG
jgi:hypothetical protein